MHPPVRLREERDLCALLPVREPRHERALNELDRLLLDVGERRTFQVPEEMRREVQDPGRLGDGPLSALEELALLGVNVDLLPLIAFLEQEDATVVLRSLQ